jgi:cytochrome P450
LPRNQTFDWVDLVSIELTTQMLAVLFDFPWDERRKLAHWSDVATAIPPDEAAEDRRHAELEQCGAYFARLWNERVNTAPRSDLLSMMAHADATRDMDPRTLGNIILLIVGGNDTTRNTMTGSVLALSDNPDQHRKLRDNHVLIDSFVPEVIRWQTPIAHMRAFHYRPGASAATSVVRLRHSPLRRAAAGGAAAQDRVGGDPQALRHDRGRGSAEAGLFLLR